MKIIGKPGEEVWVKAKIHLITLTEAGITYYVKMDGSGQSFEMKEGDIMAAAPEIIREPVNREEPKDPGAVPADPEEVPKKRRGRPRKATVEDLVARAEGERPQRIEIPDTPADRVHELVKKDDLKRRRTE